MHVLVFQRKPWLHLINRLNSLKHVQHSHAFDSNQKKKEKNKKIFNLQLFATHAILRHLLS